MSRSVHLVLLLLMVVALVAASNDPVEAVNTDVESSLNNANNDLDTDASYWGYSRPWRYGWGGGWGGWRGGGWGWRGRGWTGGWW